MEIAMTMFNVTPRYSTAAPVIWRAAGSFVARVRILIDRTIAALIARQERQAELFYLRRLGDRELRDMGLTRGDLDAGLAEAAKARIEKQMRSLGIVEIASPDRDPRV
jgi:uncharacterized protein YjiS (DUF1127 family)